MILLKINNSTKPYNIFELCSISSYFKAIYRYDDTIQLPSIVDFDSLDIILSKTLPNVSIIPRISQIAEYIGALPTLHSMLTLIPSKLASPNQFIDLLYYLLLTSNTLALPDSKALLANFTLIVRSKVAQNIKDPIHYSYALQLLGKDEVICIISTKISLCTSSEESNTIIQNFLILFGINECMALSLIRQSIPSNFIQFANKISINIDKDTLYTASLKSVYNSNAWSVMLSINNEHSIGLLLQRNTDHLPFRTICYNAQLKGSFKLFPEYSIYSFPKNWKYLYGPPAVYTYESYHRLSKLDLDIYIYEDILHGAILSYLSEKSIINYLDYCAFLLPREVECLLEGIHNRNEDEVMEFICNYAKLPSICDAISGVLKCIKFENVSTPTLLKCALECNRLSSFQSFKDEFRSEIVRRSNKWKESVNDYDDSYSVSSLSNMANVYIVGQKQPNFISQLLDYLIKENLTSYLDKDLLQQYSKLGKLK